MHATRWRACRWMLDYPAANAAVCEATVQNPGAYPSLTRSFDHLPILS